MRRSSLAGAVLGVVLGVVVGVVVVLACAGRAHAAPDADLVEALAAPIAVGVGGGVDVIVVDLPTPAGAPHVRAATTTRATPGIVASVLQDPAHFAALLPSLVRAEEVGRRGDARVVSWELEVPLFNLSGTLELRARPDGAELVLVDGDFSPGRVVFRAAPRAGGGSTLEVDARFDVKRSSWFLRQVIARSPWGEPAAAAAGAWVALRATALRAEHPALAVAFRPTAAPAWPAVGVPDGRALLRPPLVALAAHGAAALVASVPSGRLAGVSVAVRTREAPASLAARLADPRSWRAFPGWREVRPMPPAGTEAATIIVEDGIPFVDLDATWQARPAPASSAWTAIDGATRGAWFGWQVAATPDGAADAVFTLAPRLEHAGSIPRRFIEAEPLLEHGLALALAVVDALGATRKAP